MKEEADLLILPPVSDIVNNSMSTDKVWKDAFNWYNKYMNQGRPLPLRCRSCYVKVYQALKQVKNGSV